MSATPDGPYRSDLRRVCACTHQDLLQSNRKLLLVRASTHPTEKGAALRTRMCLMGDYYCSLGATILSERPARQIKIVESIPEHLFELWKQGPLLLANRSSLPVVAFANSHLELTWGSWKLRSRLGDCHFRVGRAWQMKRGTRKVRRILPFGNRDLILIDFPPLDRGFFTGRWHSMTTAPVGYTPESLDEWKSVLRQHLSEDSDRVSLRLWDFLNA